MVETLLEQGVLVTFSFPSLCCVNPPNHQCGFKRVMRVSRGKMWGGAGWMLELVFTMAMQKVSVSVSCQPPQTKLQCAASPPPPIAPVTIYIISVMETLPTLFMD